MNNPEIPESVNTKRAFVAVLSFVIDAGYSTLHDTDQEPDDYNFNLANAVEEAAQVLGIACPPDHPNPAEWDGELMSWADEAGFRPDEQTEEGEDEH